MLEKLNNNYNYYIKKDKYLSRFKWSPSIDKFERVNTKEKDNVRQKANVSKQGANEIKKFVNVMNETIDKRKPFIKTLKRKIKSISLIKLSYVDGKIVKKFKRGKIYDFKKFYGMRLNKNNNFMNKDSKIVGFTPFYIGYKESKIIPFAYNTLKTIYSELYNKTNKYSFEIKKNFMSAFTNIRQVWSGSPDSNSPHMRTSLESNDKNQKSVDDLLKIASKAKGWFVTAECDFSDPTEILYFMNYNRKAYSGTMTSKFFKSLKKGFTNQYSREMAIHLYHIVREFPMRCNTLWEVFAREKDVKIPNSIELDEDKLSTRVVWTTEEYEMLLIGWVLQKIMLANLQSGLTKYHIKNEYDGIKGYALWKKAQEYDFVVDADWSSFDSTIDTNYMVAAGLLITTPSIKSKEDQRMMFHIISSAVTKYVAVPPGIVIEVNRANASGHPGVTIYNCYVNLLRWALIGEAIYGENFCEFMDIEVYGDDAYVFFKTHKNLYKIDEIIKKLGFKSENICDALFPVKYLNHNNEVHTQPDFLKRRFRPDMGLYWNSKKLFEKIIYQSKKRDNYEQQVTILGFIETAPCDIEISSLLLNVVKNMNKFNSDEIRIDLINERIISITSLIENSDNKFRKVKDPIMSGYIYERSIFLTSVEIYLPTFINDSRYIRVENEIAKKSLFFNDFPKSMYNYLVVNKNLKFISNIKDIFDFINEESKYYKELKYKHLTFEEPFKYVRKLLSSIRIEK